MTVEDFDAKLREMLQELANKGVLIDHISVDYYQTLTTADVSCLQHNMRSL